jgi:hypothetical protein
LGICQDKKTSSQEYDENQNRCAFFHDVLFSVKDPFFRKLLSRE